MCVQCVFLLAWVETNSSGFKIFVSEPEGVCEGEFCWKLRCGAASRWFLLESCCISQRRRGLEVHDA